MASSMMRIRRTVEEYNTFAHNDEKRVDSAQTDATEAAERRALLQSELAGLPPATLIVRALAAAAIAAETAKITGVLTTVDQAIGDLDALAARYAPILADLTATLAAKSTPELVFLDGVVKDLKAEHQTLRARAVQVRTAITAAL